MTRPLKVYGAQTYLRDVRGQVWAVVAATTKKAAREALCLTAYEFNARGQETDNALDIEVATAEPGVVFYADNDRHIPDASGFTRWGPTSRSPS